MKNALVFLLFIVRVAIFLECTQKFRGFKMSLSLVCQSQRPLHDPFLRDMQFLIAQLTQ